MNKIIKPTFKEGMTKLPYEICIYASGGEHLAEIHEWLVDNIGKECPAWGNLPTWSMFWDMEKSRLNRGCYRVCFHKEEDVTLFALRWL